MGVKLLPEIRLARETLAAVVRECGPPPLPIRFRTKVLPPGLFGESSVSPQGFRITLARGGCPDCLVDTLIHETTHCYAWTEGAMYKGDHDEVWGVHYARIYCAVRGSH